MHIYQCKYILLIFPSSKTINNHFKGELNRWCIK